MVDICIPDPKTRSWQGQDCLLREFNVEAEKCELSDTNIEFIYMEPDYMTFDSNFYDIPDRTSIDGYFQSTLYFDHCTSILKREFLPKKEYRLRAGKYVSDITKKSDKPIVSIHLRRGDNTDDTNSSKELNSAYDSGGFYEEYLENAIPQFGDVVFLVFTGGSRTSNDNRKDIEWCKKYFGNRKETFHFSEGGSVVDDFARIACCSGHILSHVSSFGWWAAWVSASWDDGKKVVAPNKYHPDMPYYTHRQGFFPEEWILV